MLPKQTQNTVAYHEQQYGEDLQQHQGGNISHKLFGPDAIAVFEEPPQGRIARPLWHDARERKGLHHILGDARRRRDGDQGIERSTG